jgi:hypothetical protein
MSLLNVTKIHEEPDFLSFIAHPLANMFPMIEGNALEELKRDIAAQGILEPIRLYQGMILDGRNRYAAGKACGHTFTLADFVQWETSRPPLPLDLLARQVICNWRDDARIARRQHWHVH